jgi:hypothetical protein
LQGARFEESGLAADLGYNIGGDGFCVHDGCHGHDIIYIVDWYGLDLRSHLSTSVGDLPWPRGFGRLLYESTCLAVLTGSSVSATDMLGFGSGIHRANCEVASGKSLKPIGV